METPSEAKSLADIVKWSEENCAWQRDALRRLYSGPITKTDLDELTAICRGEKSDVEPLTLDHIRDPKSAEKAVSLLGVHGVENVNALAPGQRLTFDKTGMTVIYGDNGAGKSGYIRILKKVCRARSPKNEKIEQNVYTAKPGLPRACINFSIETQNHEVPWEQGKAAHPALSSVSVFDSRTANVHVDETNNVAYTPLPMRLLEELADLCRQVKETLAAEIAALELQTPATLSKPKCNPDTKVGQLINRLSAKTKPTDISVLAIVTPEEKQHCESLQRDLAGNPAVASRTLASLRTKLSNHIDAIRILCKAVSPDQLTALALRRDEYKAAKHAADVAAGSLFAGEPLQGVGSEVWRALWESARAYSSQEAYLGIPFPATEDGSRCVLCQQELSNEGTTRLMRFEDFVKDQSKKREAKALESLNAMLGELRAANRPVAAIRETITLMRDELQDTDSAASLRRVAIMAKWRIRSALRSKKAECEPLPPLPTIEIEGHVKRLKERSEALASESNSESRKRLVSECNELTDRLWLQLVQDDVLDEIERRRKIDALKTAQKDTNPIRITTKSVEIAEQLVTKKLRSEFVKEVDRMGVAHLAIELRKGKTTYGTPQFRVALINKPGAIVGDVLSEGEHRCIAIAAFIAELATTESRSAIIFDDPVSSLDHLHRENIAERLATESLNRQVIIFTHDIAFLFLLKQACWELDAHIGFRTVARNDHFAGYCHVDPPANARPVDMVIEAIQTQLNNQKIQYERADMASWERTVKSLEQQLRETWERVVEEAVSPVLNRLGSKVNTPGLAKMTAIELDDCKAMREAYGRCSRLLHSMPGVLNPRLPKPDKIQEEIDALRSWYTTMRDRQDAIAEV